MGYRALTDSMGGSWFPECAHFAFDRPAQLETYRRYFQCDLQFANNFTGLSFKASDLDKRNPEGDAAMARQAEGLLRLVPTPRETFSDRTKHVIYLLLPGGTANVEAVARNLGIGVRSLQRELEKEGVTFARLLHETRRELARRYLAGATHPIAEIAELVGYSSPSAFSRWFSAEFGMPPHVWRSQLRQ
jgi:AraC-like DNA-binding protein